MLAAAAAGAGCVAGATVAGGNCAGLAAMVAHERGPDGRDLADSLSPVHNAQIAILGF